ncbi:MAG: hypothetical protein Kow00122_04650 [Thermoleophilia bacterium]
MAERPPRLILISSVCFKRLYQAGRSIQGKNPKKPSGRRRAAGEPPRWAPISARFRDPHLVY